MTSSSSTVGLQPSITSARRYISHLLATDDSLKLPPIPEWCVISYTPKLTQAILGQHRHKSFSIGTTNPIQLHFIFPENGVALAVAQGLHGAPMAAVLLEELIALGFAEFVVIGPAGHPVRGLSANMLIGDLLLVTQAAIYEGTSSHYGRQGVVNAGSAALARMDRVLKASGAIFRYGTVATTDALYRETKSFLQELLEHQIAAIDMEMSALYAVAAHYAKDICGILYISDLVRIDGVWEIGLSPVEFADLVARLLDVVNNLADSAINDPDPTCPSM